VSSLGAGRDQALSMHPTVKATALVADAIRDCSRRGDVILDAFGGSGTTLIAAESCGRSARLIEFDQLYCDTIVRRYAALRALARYERRRRALRRLADRLRIGHVVLLPLDEGLHVRRRDQAGLVTQGGDLAAQ